MQSILNQYSYIVISLAILSASVILLWRYGIDRRIVAGVALFLATFSAAGLLLLRPGISDIDSVSSAQAALRNGKPTLIEFFSNYCAGCLALRPAVDLLVADIADEYNILRIDIHTELGRELRQNFQFSYTPEFILLDSSGQEVWRAHNLPPREQVYALAPQLLSSLTTPPS
ncbi:MAG TPA: thioredoxin domain-containing protein [Spirillospora sp.]|nr:thioredoxin domain-containing protein [Spirillospora sp.]